MEVYQHNRFERKGPSSSFDSATGKHIYNAKEVPLIVASKLKSEVKIKRWEVSQGYINAYHESKITGESYHQELDIKSNQQSQVSGFTVFDLRVTADSDSKVDVKAEHNVVCVAMKNAFVKYGAQGLLAKFVMGRRVHSAVFGKSICEE